MGDPAQLAAWDQAQAMMTTAWQLQQLAQLQQMASWQPQATAFTLPAYEASVALPAALTPRTSPAPASEATPTKTEALASDRSTEPGSPSGATEGTSEEEPMPADVQPPLLQLAELAQ